MRTLAALFALSVPCIAGQVIVVGSGPQQLPQIQDAVNVAHDGDVILIKSGSYLSFVVANKDLTITADVGQAVDINGAIRVRNLSADRTLTIVGLTAVGHASSNVFEGDGFFATDCAGLICIQGCSMSALTTVTPCSEPVRHGAQLENCAAVSFIDCTMQGGNANTQPMGIDGFQGSGLLANGSSVELFQCTLHGASQFGRICNGYNDGAPGGHGAYLFSSNLFAAGCTFQGGMGTTVNCCFEYGGNGGTAVFADTSNVLDMQECTYMPGIGGGGACGIAICDGYPGGTICSCAHDVPGPRRTLQASTPVARESTTLGLNVSGASQDFVALGIRREAGLVFDPGLNGSVLTGGPSPTRFLSLGMLMTTNRLFAIPLGPLPAGESGRRLLLQTLHVDASGQFWVSNPLPIAVVSHAY